MSRQYWKKYEELSLFPSLVHPVVLFLAFLFVFVESPLTRAQNSKTSLIWLLREHSPVPLVECLLIFTPTFCFDLLIDLLMLLLSLFIQSWW